MKWIDVARVSVSLNVAMLFGLTWVWARNYLSFRSKHAAGLALFGGLLLV